MAQHTPNDGDDTSHGGPPTWGPQRPWESGPKAGGPRTWAIVVVALIAVLGVIAGATVYFTRDSTSTAASTAAPDPLKADAAAPTGATTPIASAGDTAAVGVIADDPTCIAWTGIDAGLQAAEQTSWSGRDPAIPASQWTPSRRDSYDSVGAAMRTAADQTAALAAQTPHRVMGELYDQTAAYLRAYVDSLPTYTAVNDHLALTADATSSALSTICTAIADGTAAGRATLAAAAKPPTAAPAPNGDPVPFLQPPTDSVCAQWHGLVAKYTAGFAAWRATDAGVPAAQWGPVQRQVNDVVAPVMMGFADDAEALAQSSTNQVFQDFATLAAQYRRAYAAALPTYVPGDATLTQTASAATLAIDEACSATEG
jgi:hypothetical protein